jgi:hypothetical protein
MSENIKYAVMCIAGYSSSYQRNQFYDEEKHYGYNPREIAIFIPGLPLKVFYCRNRGFADYRDVYEIKLQRDRLYGLPFDLGSIRFRHIIEKLGHTLVYTDEVRDKISAFLKENNIEIVFYREPAIELLPTKDDTYELINLSWINCPEYTTPEKYTYCSHELHQFIGGGNLVDKRVRNTTTYCMHLLVHCPCAKVQVFNDYIVKSAFDKKSWDFYDMLYETNTDEPCDEDVAHNENVVCNENVANAINNEMFLKSRECSLPVSPMVSLPPPLIEDNSPIAELGTAEDKKSQLEDKGLPVEDKASQTDDTMYYLKSILKEIRKMNEILMKLSN